LQFLNRNPEPTIKTRKTLHIVDTAFLNGSEVLVSFSDGTAAVYEAEELEKLRPAAKYTTAHGTDAGPRHENGPIVNAA